MNIYFARHGQTDWNTLGKVQGTTDIPLNETWIDQAKQLCEHFEKQDISLKKVYTSRQIRAVQTARIVSDRFKIEYEAVPGLEETWDDFKRLFPDREDRMKDFFVIELEYLDTHPDSGYFTEIRGLDYFPDYIDYLPQGAIPAKVKMMYYLPSLEEGMYPFTGFSRNEYVSFLDSAAAKSIDAITETERLLQSAEILIF